jgi:hypothetical protein
MSNPDQLSAAELARLRAAGVDYPWTPGQSLTFLERAEKAEAELAAILAREAAEQADMATFEKEVVAAFANDPIDAALERELAPAQIARLASFIMAEIPGEPSANEGAVDTAIRLLRAAYVGRVTIARLPLAEQPFQYDKPVPRLVGDLRRFIGWYGPFGVLEGLRHAFNGAPSAEAVDRMVGEHLAARELLGALHPLWRREDGNGEGG